MGTIIKRNKSYQVQISNYKNGKQNRITKTFKSKSAAKHWKREMELMKGKGAQLAHWNTPFPKFYSDWVYFVKRSEVQESTFQNYERSIKIINNLFKNIELRNLNDFIVQSKIDEYASTRIYKTLHSNEISTRSYQTVNDLLAKIKSALRYAFARGYIFFDFTKLLKARGHRLENYNRVLSLQEYKTLRDYLVNNMIDKFHVYVYLVLETGLRRGEALGVRSIDVLPNCIRVRESISPTSDDRTLKTATSNRDITISKEMYNILKSTPIESNGYIFERNFNQSSRLEKLLNSLNIPKTTIQGLRRTHASIAYAYSKDDLHVSDRLGHSSIHTTHQYYLELIPETKAQKDGELLHHLANI